MKYQLTDSAKRKYIEFGALMLLSGIAPMALAYVIFKVFPI